jgi:uncharacterized protein
MEKETRVFQFSAEVRDGDNGEPVIDGLAAVYNSESNDLGGFVEVIEPGFFSDVLADDVRALWNHNADKPLGRTISGTLQLVDTDAGLRAVINPPDNTWGRDAVVSIKRGDVSQMSFAFTVNENGAKYERMENGLVKRTLLPGGAAGLYDVSPVTYPAYNATTVAVRGIIEEMQTAAGAADAPIEDDQTDAKAQARKAARRRQLDLEKLK